LVDWTAEIASSPSCPFLEHVALEQDWRTALKARVQMSANFEEILWPPHENFEEQNKVLEPSTIIANCCIRLIIIIIIIIIYGSLHR